MNDERPDLSEAQRWMQAVITHPDGVLAGLASGDARRNLDVALEDLEGVVTRSEALTGAERLAIYSRSYHARLLECFRAEYPCLLHALGDDLFNQFAVTYLQAYPSQSYTLYDLGKNFPRYLADSRPDADASPDERESWPDFIVDMAMLERAFMEVYDGPGVEGEVLVSGAHLWRLPPARLAETHFVPAPCLRLLAFRYPVPAYFTAVRRDEAPAMPGPTDTHLAMTRIDYVVRFFDLAPVQHAFLNGLMASLSVNQAIAAIGSDTISRSEAARTWLCRWADHGFFLRVRES